MKVVLSSFFYEVNGVTSNGTVVRNSKSENVVRDFLKFEKNSPKSRGNQSREARPRPLTIHGPVVSPVIGCA